MKIFYVVAFLVVTLSACGKTVSHNGNSFNTQSGQNSSDVQSQQKDVFALNNALNQNSHPSALSNQNDQSFKMGMTDTMPNLQQNNQNEWSSAQQTNSKSSSKQNKSKKSYKIQCGFFKNEHLAEQVVYELNEAGIDDVKIVNDNDGYRVLVGDYETKTEGKNDWNKLTKFGFDAKFWTFR